MRCVGGLEGPLPPTSLPLRGPVEPEQPRLGCCAGAGDTDRCLHRCLHPRLYVCTASPCRCATPAGRTCRRSATRTAPRQASPTTTTTTPAHPRPLPWWAPLGNLHTPWSRTRRMSGGAYVHAAMRAHAHRVGDENWQHWLALGVLQASPPSLDLHLHLHMHMHGFASCPRRQAAIAS